MVGKGRAFWGNFGKNWKKVEKVRDKNISGKTEEIFFFKWKLLAFQLQFFGLNVIFSVAPSVGK